MSIEPAVITEKADELCTCAKEYTKTTVADILSIYGYGQDKIDKVKAAIDNANIDTTDIEATLKTETDALEEKLEPLAQQLINREAIENTPQKPKSSVNGVQSNSVVEPINVSKVSSPKDIPMSNDSFEDDHPNTFGNKDRAGNFTKHNLVSGLYQQGLANGYLFRSDQNGNTTQFIPGNLKYNIAQTMNINSGSSDWIINGEGHIESSKKITIVAPEIEFIGDVKVIGTQTNTSTIVASGGISSAGVVAGAVDVTFAGKSSLKHRHKQNPGDHYGGGAMTDPAE